jgi:AsmA-like C-terminal region
VRAIAKPFLLSGSIILGIYLILWIGGNLLIQIPSVKNRVLATLSSALNAQARFETLSLNSGFGISLSGISAQSKDQRLVVSSKSLTLHASLGSLIHGELIPKSILLDHPEVTLRLGMPASNAPPTPPPMVSPERPQGASHDGKSFSSSSLENHSVGKIPSPSSSAVDPLILLDCLSIRNGTLRVLNADSHPLLQLNDLEVRGDEEPLTVRAQSAIINDSLIIRNLKASALMEEDGQGRHLVFRNISATLGGGMLSGLLRCGYPSDFPTYNCSLQLSGANFKSLLKDASMMSPVADGTINADLSLAGTAGKGSTMTGKGSIRCKESTVEPAPFLKQIGQLLNIDELKLLRLAEGKCVFEIEQGRLVIEELLLRSENLVLSATGPLQSSGELNLDSRLLFNEKLTSRVRGFLGSQLSPAPEAGYSQISFHVTGPASNPRTDLIERLTGIHLGGNLGGLGGILQGLFGKPIQQPPQQVPATSAPAH